MPKLQNQTQTLELNMPHKFRYLKNFSARLQAQNSAPYWVFQRDLPHLAGRQGA